MVRTAVAAAVLMAVLASTEARAEFYKWVDRDGREFITNEKEKIPAEYRGSAKPVEVRDDRVSVGRKQAVDRNGPAAAPDHKDRYGRGEQYWRKRAENLRRQLREQEDDLDLLARQEKDDEGSLRKSAASAKKARSARAKKRAVIERKIAKLKRELDVDLPEEARKADAYPGWLRE
ncbi:MAG: hypothetical protein ACYC7L_15905 [Nitrospirota bacterium]